MQIETSTTNSNSSRRNADQSRSRGSRSIPATGATILVAAALWRVSQGDLYAPGSDLGYALGLVGGCMMLALLTYPLRKRAAALSNAGPLRHWFKAHMVLGILGPLFIMFHSTLRIGSPNAAVAFGCMVLVATSGIVGRFIYRQIHHGLYGARASVDELQADLERQMRELEPTFRRIAEVRTVVDAFMSRTRAVPTRLTARALHFVVLFLERPVIRWRIRRQFSAHADEHLRKGGHAPLAVLMATIDDLLAAVHRHAQFSTYERLFVLWHVVHLPFVYMLAASAIVHVVAVHMY